MKPFLVISLAVFFIPPICAASFGQSVPPEETLLAPSILQQRSDFNGDSLFPSGQLFLDYRVDSNSSNLSPILQTKVWSALSPVKAFAALDEAEHSLAQANKGDPDLLADNEPVDLQLVLDEDQPAHRNNNAGLLKRIAAAGLRLSYRY